VAIELLLVFTLVSQTLPPSAFDPYAAHLEPSAMRAACRLQDTSHFRNLTYQFRARAYPGQRSLQFKDGRYDDRFGLSGGDIEWSTELEREESILLDQDRAVLLTFFADHVGGTGSVSHVLVIRCKDEHLEVVFEAGGEGVRSSYSGAGDLQITHPFWSRGDSHASPTSLVDERYHWDAGRGHFVLIRRSESEIRIRLPQGLQATRTPVRPG
jgi:hypothetical protein